MLVPRKIERPRLKDLNSNSFEFNSNGFELGLGKRKVQKCSDFWWSSGIWWKNIWQGWRPRIKITKALGYFACGLWLIPNKWNNFIIALNIGRVCYKEKSPFPRFKWIKDPCHLFSWVKKRNDMMAWWHDAMHMMQWWMQRTKQVTQRNPETLEGIWSSGLGASQHSTTTRGSRPEI